jgi:signal transduction histidine kinase
MVEGVYALVNLKRQNQKDWKIFSLDAVFSEVQSAYAETIKSKSATINIEKNLPIVKGNFQQLVLLFKQLLDNSLTFVNPDRIPLITIKTSEVYGSEIKGSAEIIPGTKYLKISFADNGNGFSSDFTDKIFEIFQKLEQNEQDEGLGIGLAMCKKIVLNHDGLIEADSMIGEGTIITIYLPVVL